MEHQQTKRTAQTADHQRKHLPGGAKSSPSHRSQPLLMQVSRALGNQAMGRLLQAKLEVNEPGDEYEQEADRIADQVMRMPEPTMPTISQGDDEQVQRKCAACACGHGLCPKCAEEKKAVQRKAEDADLSSGEAPPLVHDVLNSPGEPLDPAARDFFEPRFGRDFSGVRLHYDATAADAAQSVKARAYTSGQHIAFGAGEYAPAREGGRRLIAHELVHVVQQSSK